MCWRGVGGAAGVGAVGVCAGAVGVGAEGVGAGATGVCAGVGDGAGVCVGAVVVCVDGARKLTFTPVNGQRSVQV